MSNYILSTNEDERRIIEFKKTKSYTFSPKTKKGNFKSLKTVYVYDEERIQKIIINKYRIKYKRLISIIQSIMNSDDATEGDIMMCLNEISKLQSMLIIKYQELLQKESFEYFLNDLYFLEKVMKDKLMEYRNQEMYSRGGKR